MADDTPAALSVQFPGGPVTMQSAKDSGNIYSFQSSPRVRGGIVTDDNPMPTVLSTPLPAGANVVGSFHRASSAITNSTSGTMGESADIVVPASGTRKWVIVFNRSESDKQDLGASGVTVGGGIPLESGAGYLFDGIGAAGPIYGISNNTDSAYSYVEG